MSYGHWGKGLRVNLTEGTIAIETLDETFLRRYVGGWGFIGYYLLKELEPGIDPLGPDNKLIYATGPVTGQAIAGGGRHQIGAKSPLTGGFAASEAGGFFGAELKRAGWDLIIFEGVSPKPVYLAIKDDQVELRSAEALWGQKTADVEDVIREELDDRRVRVSQCGLAGENQVLLANVMHDATRASGRTGLGAVMGSKNLKAVAVRGTQRPPTGDPDKVREMARWFVDNFKDTGSAAFAGPGTMRMVRVNQGVGGLPTRNFAQGVFAGYENLSFDKMESDILIERDTCYGCPVRCKYVVEVKEGDHPVDPRYGGPEYETTGALGSCCGIDDLKLVAYAGQLCNAYGLDTIGTGVTISFAMECFEKGLIGLKETGGIDLRFGNAQAMIEMVEQIAHRRGFGDQLANGSWRVAQQIGGDAPLYSISVKKQEVAMHDPRTKWGHGLGVAVSPTGADHMNSVHDSGYQTDGGIMDLKPLGVYEPLPYDDLSTAKVHMVRQAMMWRTTFNMTGICSFHSYSTQQVSELIAACTGWNTSVMELWLAGERAYDLARAFNAREGFGPADDVLPQRMMQALDEGPQKGKVYSQEVFDAAMKKFYELMDWDAATAAPTRAKLEMLDVAWVADKLGL